MQYCLFNMSSLNTEWENFTINSKSNLKVVAKKKKEYTNTKSKPKHIK